MKTKEIEIDWNNEKKIVKLKRLSFGEMNDVRELSTDIKVVANQPVVRVSQKALMEQSLLKGIIEAPFTIDLSSIRGLDNEVGARLYEEFVELNQVEEKKN